MPNFLKKSLLFLLIAGAAFFVAAKWGEDRVVRIAEQKIAQLGILKYDSLHVSLLEGDVSFYEAAIGWKWPEAGKQLSLRSPEIRIKGIKWRKLFFDKKLKVKSLRVASPDMAVREIPVDTSSKQASTVTAQNEGPPIELINLEIGKVKLEGGCFELLQPLPRNREEVATATAGGVHISLTDLKFNLQADVVTAPTMNKADLRLEGIEVDFPNHSHRFTLDQFHLNRKDSVIGVVGLHMQPNDRPSELFRKSKYKQAWTDLSLGRAVVSGWHFRKLVEGSFVAHAIRLSGLGLKVRTNQNLLPDPNGYKPMPQELLRNAGFPILVDNVLVEDSRLQFEHIGKGRSDFGALNFEPFNVTITNLTNDSGRIAEQKTMRVDAVANCQTKHRVANTFWFDLASPDCDFSFKGSAEDLPFSSLNSFIKPCVNVAFEDGTINHVSFEANGNRNHVKGKLNLDYKDLDFTLLDEERDKRKLLSRFVDMLIEDDNDRGKASFNRGEISTRRNPRKAFINYWWMAIQSGIKTSLLEDKMLERIDKFATKRKQKQRQKRS